LREKKIKKILGQYFKKCYLCNVRNNKNEVQLKLERKKVMATMLEKIERGLKNGIVTFRFHKLDGSVRLAIGTLQKDILATKPIRKSDGSSSPMVQVFWDLEKNAWRSFQKGNEIDIINFIPTDVDILTPKIETETTETTETETTETETKIGSREELIGKLLEKMLSVASPRPTSKFGEGMTDGLDMGKTLEKIFSIAMGGAPMGVVMGGGVPTETETTKTEIDLKRKINETLGKIDEMRNELGNIEETLKDIYYAM